jgi:hypothetical protein
MTRHPLAPRIFLSVATVLLGTCAATLAAAADSTTQLIVTALKHGDCEKAVKAVNNSMNGEDAQVDFIAGRMSDEGVCVHQDSNAATDLYKRSLELGNRASALDYGAKIGLGEGAPQSYEQAGQICRSGGVDAAGQLSNYSLGYACTVSAVAARMLRQDLHKGAIVPGGGAAAVSFVPASGALQLRTLPRVSMEDGATGTHIRKPTFDAHAKIPTVWQQAMNVVPKPDPSRLESKAVDLPLDLEMTIEAGRDPTPGPQSTIYTGEITRHQ